jgi:hypothetical protein
MSTVGHIIGATLAIAPWAGILAVGAYLFVKGELR